MNEDESSIIVLHIIKLYMRILKILQERGVKKNIVRMQPESSAMFLTSGMSSCYVIQYSIVHILYRKLDITFLKVLVIYRTSLTYNTSHNLLDIVRINANHKQNDALVWPPKKTV